MHATKRNVRGIGNGQPDMAVDAGAAIPSAGLADVLDLDGEHVFLAGGFEIGREIIEERRVAIRMIAQVPAVEPNVRVHINAVETDGDVLPANRKAAE